MFDGSAFRGLEILGRIMFWMLCFCVPLAIWKLVEIILWLWDHVSISIK